MEKSTEQPKKYNESRENLVGFFALLLKVDKRVNPHLYESKEEINN